MTRLYISYLVMVLWFQQSYSQPCDCWEEVFRNQPLGYYSAVAQLEAEFIRNGYLNDSSGNSYFRLADSIIQRNHYFISDAHYDPLLFESFSTCFLINECSKSLYRRFKKFQKRLLGLANISPALAYGQFKEHFNRKDFKHPEMKHFFMTFYYAPIIDQPTVLRDVQETHEYAIAAPSEPQNILKVYLAGNDSIIVQNRMVNIDDMRNIAITFISDTTNSNDSPEVDVVHLDGFGDRKVSRQVISLTYDPSIAYDFYVRVQNELIAAYTSVRNAYAKAEFGISYDEMLGRKEVHEREIQIIRRMVALRISETE